MLFGKQNKRNSFKVDFEDQSCWCICVTVPAEEEEEG